MTFVKPCDHCEQPILGHDGYLTVNIDAANARGRQYRAQKRNGTSTRKGPALIPWRLVHAICDDQVPGTFVLDVARIRDERDLVRHIAAIAQLSWTQDTDLRGVVAAILDANPAPGVPPPSKRQQNLARRRTLAIKGPSKGQQHDDV